MGSAYDKKEEYDRAIEYYEKALKLELERCGPDNPDIATSYNNFGLRCTKAKDYEKAFEYLSKAAEKCMDERGDFSFKNAPVIGNYGHALGMRGETEKGLFFSHRSLKCKLEQETPSYSSIQKSYQKLTEIFEHSGDKTQTVKYKAMVKWAELRTQGQFLEKVDPKAFEKEVGIPYSRAIEIEEEIKTVSD